MSWGHLRLQRSPAVAVPEPKIPQATCEQAGVWLFVPAWQAPAGRSATQRNLIVVATLLSEQDAGVVGERLRIEGGAVGAAELGDPVLRLGRVRAVPAGVGSVEEVDGRCCVIASDDTLYRRRAVGQVAWASSENAAATRTAGATSS